MSAIVKIASRTETLGGTPYYHAAVTNTSILVKAGRLTLYGIAPGYSGTTHGFFLLYDAATAGAVTPGTTPPTFVVTCYPGANYISFGDMGIAFNTGLVICGSTAATGTGGIDTALSVSLSYAFDPVT